MQRQDQAKNLRQFENEKTSMECLSEITPGMLDRERVMKNKRDREVLRNGQESERGLEAGFEKENSENEK